MRKVFIIMAAAVILIGCAGKKSMKEDPMKMIEGYQAWTQVGGLITGDVSGVLGPAHAGATGWRKIFINETGENSSMSENFPYPEGTIVVKESYMDKNGAPGMMGGITVMVKKPAGYDPENGDWCYMMKKPDSTEVKKGKMGMCIGCHKAAEDMDYVFTTLLNQQ